MGLGKAIAADAHDAGLVLGGGLEKNPLQLMLMMLSLFRGVWKKAIAADAHDAVPVSGGFGKNPLQLMLMMLSLFWGVWEKPIAADAHDAGPVLGNWDNPIAADAHDAGPDAHDAVPVSGVLGKTHCS